MTQPGPVRVLIVEDDPETRAHLERAVAAHRRLLLLRAVGGVAEGRAVLQAATKPDVMLVDLGLPDGDGIELIRLARKCSPTTLILVVSVFGEESRVIASVRAGASGYLLKDGATSELASSIVAMVDGGSPLSPSIARYVLRLVQDGAPSEPTLTPELSARTRVPKLTKREIEVLEILGRGFSSIEIAKMLGLSVHTVIAHTRSIHRKLEVTSRSAAIFEAVSLGLLRLHD